MIEIIIRILTALFFLFFGISGQAVPPPIDQEPTIHSQTSISDVQGMVLTSFPAQIVLQISGAQTDGCNYPVQITQTRSGNTVTLDIYREVPMSVMCPQVVLPYNDSIKLDGSFEPGTYTIHVNEYTLEVKV